MPHFGGRKVSFVKQVTTWRYDGHPQQSRQAARRGPGDAPATSGAGRGEPRKAGGPREALREGIGRTPGGARRWLRALRGGRGSRGERGEERKVPGSSGAQGAGPSGAVARGAGSPALGGRGGRGFRDWAGGGVAGALGAGLRAAEGRRSRGGAGRGRGVSGRPGMASMAAAIAASRSAVMSGNRPLDDRERKRFTYFSSLSPMARKIMLDKEKIREKYGPEWARLPPAQQDEIIDRCLVAPSAPAPRDPGDPEELARFPGLRGPTGQKVVRFGDEVGAERAGLPRPPRRPGPGGPLPASSRPARRAGRGWRGEGAGTGVGGTGGPEPEVWGWGAPRGSSWRTAERRKEVIPDPPSGAAPPGRRGPETCQTKVPTARDFKPGRPGFWSILPFSSLAVGDLTF